jgi:SAM-dependent methyltransferase
VSERTRNTPLEKENDTVNKSMNEQLKRIRKAYDMTVEQYNNGIDPLANVPQEFKNSPEFKEFLESSKGCGSSNPDIRDYLSPAAGMRFLDAGCCANLANYRFDKWPSLYYGVDISPRLIEAMKGFARRENIAVGGLFVADISSLPFGNDFFDIAMMIGVLEYCSLPYIKDALQELSRVLKPSGRAILDIPNPGHPHYPLMIALEEYLSRPNIACSRASFEEALEKLFKVTRVDDSRVMIKYFVENNK